MNNLYLCDFETSKYFLFSVRNCEMGISEFTNAKQLPEVFYKKAVLKNFAIFTGKHLYWSRPIARSFTLRGQKIFKKAQLEGRLKQVSLEQYPGHNTT